MFQAHMCRRRGAAAVSLLRFFSWETFRVVAPGEVDFQGGCVFTDRRNVLESSKAEIRSAKRYNGPNTRCRRDPCPN